MPKKITPPVQGNKNAESFALVLASAGRASVPHWIASVEPYFDVMRRLYLPPRGARGSRQNSERARIINAALHQERVRRSGKCERTAARRRCDLCRVRVRLAVAPGKPQLVPPTVKP